MGIFRGGILISLLVILFITVLLGSVFLTMSLSLDYQNVKKEISPFVKNLTEGTGEAQMILEDFGLFEFGLGKKTEEALEVMPQHCQIFNDYVFSFEGHTITLHCSSLQEGREAVFGDAVEGFVESAYYKNYECKFWSCLKEKGLPFFLVSEKAKNYWQNKFYISLAVFLALAILISFFVEQKRNIPAALGTIFMFSSLPLLKLENVVNSVTGKVFGPFIRIFFVKSDVLFWWVFILGAILFVSSLALKIWNWEFIKNKFSKYKSSKNSSKNKS